MAAENDLERCPYCERRVRLLPVIYGTPTPQEMEAMERGEVRIRGRVPGFHDAHWACSDCGAEW
jgi:DNA-directed RNA polymerase subunit RPC12/RpoP